MITVIHDDCRNFLNTNNTYKFHLLLTDPPYGNVTNEEYDKIKDYKDFTYSWLPQVKNHLHDNASLYIWCSIGPKSSSLLDIASCLKNLYHFQDMIVWSKQRGRGNRKGWLFTREEILWATMHPKDYIWNKNAQYSKHKYAECWIKRLKKENNPYKRATNVWTDIEEVSIEQARQSGGRGERIQLHPNQKPKEAIKRIILAHTNEDDWVLDCFGGCGTTAIVAKELNRNCVIIENDKKYIDIINEQI